MTFLETPLYAYSQARSIHFQLQFAAMNSLALPFKKTKHGPRQGDPKLIREAALKLLREDSHNIATRVYPASVLWPESPARHLARMPRLMFDGFSLQRRRAKGRTTQFSAQAASFLSELPRYYRRNFHFQTDGYLSKESAELYEHQVELLFAGTADAMRRAILAPMRKRFGKSDGSGLVFLEVGAGTGRASRFVRQAFPKARIVVTDLSEPYLRVAADRLHEFSRFDYVHADGAKLPFQDKHFDAVYSVFLFHEMPLDVRRLVLAESKRVLKPRGFFGFVDSVQKGDSAAFDPTLDKFPADFHEPFYRNYIGHPMEKLLKVAGFRGVKKSVAFASKVCWASR